MARRGSQPALYELIRSRGPERPLAMPQRAEPHAAPAAGGMPARVVRVPVGYLWFALAAGIVVIVAAYLYGVSVGERVARDQLAAQRSEELDAAATLPKVDPLRAGELPKSLTDRSGSGSPAAPRPGEGALGPAMGGDPRQDGLNYFILAHAAPSGAARMVEFCRDNGLDAHLVPDDNGELRVVIATPGFAAGERQSTEVKALEAKIKSVGRQWKAAARGNRDFNDAYPKKFQR